MANVFNNWEVIYTNRHANNGAISLVGLSNEGIVVWTKQGHFYSAATCEVFKTMEG